jgi:hypothetical protein
LLDCFPKAYRPPEPVVFANTVTAGAYLHVLLPAREALPSLGHGNVDYLNRQARLIKRRTLHETIDDYSWIPPFTYRLPKADLLIRL